MRGRCSELALAWSRPEPFTAFAKDAVCTPVGGAPSEIASPRPGDQLTVDAETFVVQGEPERRDRERLVWTVDIRLA